MFWISTGCSVIFYRMFRNGILEDGWRKKVEEWSMEVDRGVKGPGLGGWS
jgi:hypothetical protein